MRYISTRGEDFTGFPGVLMQGLASDGGLFVPGRYPQLDMHQLRSKSYQGIAFAVLRKYLDMDAKVLRGIIEETYTEDVFGSPQIVPIRWLDPHLALLGLSNGPTLAFKDLALQFYGNLLARVLADRQETAVILGATSGDTGSAAEYALRGRKGVTLAMLSPWGRMSEFQRRQMYTLQDKNIHNIAINGTFDDCQAVVKQVNADAEFKRQFRLGAVNSINWVRIAAQSVYYVWAYCQMTQNDGQEIDVCVPSGNFGNALAAYVAREMGARIRRIIIATNENDVLHEFVRTGIYRVRTRSEVRETSSPSMDIAEASNLERLIFELLDRSPDMLRELWDELKEKGQFDARFLMFPHTARMDSGTATDADVLGTIRMVYKQYGRIIDPHTAVGVKVGLECRRRDDPLLVAETASPAKFAYTIREAIGIDPPIPPSFADLGALPERYVRMDPDPEKVKEYIRHVA